MIDRKGEKNGNDDDRPDEASEIHAQADLAADSVRGDRIRGDVLLRDLQGAGHIYRVRDDVRI